MTPITFVRVALATALLAAPVPALAGDALDPAQKQAVRDVVREYLKENPEVVIEAIREYQAREEAAEQARVSKTLADSRDSLEQDPDTPFAGNRSGDVTVVEFFDYNCGYCKRVTPSVVELVGTDSGVKVAFKELPILGPTSGMASRVSMAVWRTAPDRYMAFHTAMMRIRGGVTEQKVWDVAAEAGLDVAGLKTAMKAPEIEAAIQRNMVLARRLGISGTPAFVIGTEVVPGAIDLETLRHLVKAARKG